VSFRPSFASFCTFEMSGRYVSLGGFLMESDSPKYVVGRFIRGHWIVDCMTGSISVGMEIGMYPLFVRFILSPEISPKSCRMAWITLMFSICVGVKIVVSSANCSIVVWKLGIAISKSFAWWRID
jgi:hypothetical protein